MSPNAIPSPVQESLVRKRAYEIWEKQGHPHGKDKEHWEQASRELSASRGSDAALAASETPAAQSRGPVANGKRRDRPQGRMHA